MCITQRNYPSSANSWYLSEKDFGRDTEPCCSHVAGEHVNLKSILHNLLKVNNISRDRHTQKETKAFSPLNNVQCYSYQWFAPLPNNSEKKKRVYNGVSLYQTIVNKIFLPLSSLFTYLCQGNASAIFHFQCQRSVTSAWPQANFYLMIVEKLLHLRAVRFSHLEFTQDTK